MIELPINQIIQGDCLEIMGTLPDKCVDLIVTDPPYNTGMTKSTSVSSTRLNSFFDDSYTDDEYLKLVRGGAYEMFRLLKDNSAIYCFINWKKLGLWIDELTNAGFNVKNTIVWDKVVHGLNYQNYAYTHEFCIFAVKGKFWPNNKDGKFFKDVWTIKRNMGNNNISDHETQKAEDIIMIPIIHGSKEGDIVLDPFMGSGTTARVAKKLNRKYIGMELVSDYIDAANKTLRQEVLL